MTRTCGVNRSANLTYLVASTTRVLHASFHVRRVIPSYISSNPSIPSSDMPSTTLLLALPDRRHADETERTGSSRHPRLQSSSEAAQNTNGLLCTYNVTGAIFNRAALLLLCHFGTFICASKSRVAGRAEARSEPIKLRMLHISP
jgi:hypothetical protein